MMRIKEAIQRRKLIQQLNDEYLATQIDTEPHPYGHKRFSGFSCAKLSYTTWGTQSATGDDVCDGSSKKSMDFVGHAENHEAYISLAQFVGEFNGRLTDGHRRALRVTWNRLSEPPKTSGRGVLKIMERIFEELMSKNPEMMHCFYRSAFIKCMKDRKRQIRGNGTIVTVRDHAHLLIELIDGIMCILFDVPNVKPIWDPVSIGKAHACLIPFGFDKEIWHTLGAVLAEVMFCQDCVRAYPLAASAWSMLSVSLSDRMFRHTKLPVPMRSFSKQTGDWSQQTSMNTDNMLLNLSADLQRKAMISLRGTGHCPSSTASSFRRASECVKQKRIELQKELQQEKNRKKSILGWKQQRTFSRDSRRTSLGLGAHQIQQQIQQQKQQQQLGEQRRTSSLAGMGHDPSATPMRRERPKLEKAPSFFSRTIASLASPMPSSSSLDSQHRKGSGRHRHRIGGNSPSREQKKKGIMPPSPLAIMPSAAGNNILGQSPRMMRGERKLQKQQAYNRPPHKLQKQSSMANLRPRLYSSEQSMN